MDLSKSHRTLHLIGASGVKKPKRRFVATVGGFLVTMSLLTLFNPATISLNYNGWIPINSHINTRVDQKPLPPTIVTYREKIVLHHEMTVGAFTFHVESTTAASGEQLGTRRRLTACKLYMIEEDEQYIRKTMLANLGFWVSFTVFTTDAAVRLAVSDNATDYMDAAPPLNDTYALKILHHGRVYAEIEASDDYPNTGVIKYCRLNIVPVIHKPLVLKKLSRLYSRIKEVSFDAMMQLVQDCEALQPTKTAPHHYVNPDDSNLSLFTMMRGIVPGTKWCGYNDIALNYHDLGDDFALDKCCRAHDHCPVKIKAFTTNFGVRNYHPYTKSHCACDDIFYDCLKRASSERANAIGNIFFNVLSLQCATPATRKVCLEYSSTGRNMEGEPAPPVVESEGGQEIARPRMFLGLGKKCVRWAEDTDAEMQLKFRLPARRY